MAQSATKSTEEKPLGKAKLLPAAEEQLFGLLNFFCR